MHHAEKKYQCSTCAAEFSRKLTYQYHLTTHLKRQYACEVCNKKFRLESSLKMHTEGCQRKHGKQEVTESKSGLRCPQCNKECSSAVALECHKRRHQPTACKICGLTFDGPYQAYCHRVSFYLFHSTFLSDDAIFVFR